MMKTSHPKEAFDECDAWMSIQSRNSKKAEVAQSSRKDSDAGIASVAIGGVFSNWEIWYAWERA